MKKVISLVCLLAMVATCLFVFASCGATPNSDPAKAEEALKAAGYTCVDSKLGASMLVGAEPAKKIEKAITAYKADDRMDTVTIYWFADEDSAKAAYDNIDSLVSEAGGDDVYGVSGKMVWAGAEAAVKAAQ